jgi:FkbM family methyltransferase
MWTKLMAIVRLLYHRKSQGNPSISWLLHTTSPLDSKFIRKHRSELRQIARDADFQYLRIDNQIFAWPKEAPIEPLLHILSELLQTHHPHHYNVPPTAVERGDMVLDIGACEGAFSAFAVEQGAEAIMVEPSRSMASVIKRLFELRKLPSPIIVQCLLGDKAGELHYEDNPNNPGASRLASHATDLSYPVPVLTLDEFVAKYLLRGVTLIKCDAEGSDAKIIISGRQTLLKYKPKLAITTYHNSDDYQIMEQFLLSLGCGCKGKGLLYCAGAFRTLMLHGAFPKSLPLPHRSKF